MTGRLAAGGSPDWRSAVRRGESTLALADRQAGLPRRSPTTNIDACAGGPTDRIGVARSDEENRRMTRKAISTPSAPERAWAPIPRRSAPATPSTSPARFRSIRSRWSSSPAPASRSTRSFATCAPSPRAAGGDFGDLVKLNIYLTDLADFPLVNEVMAEYFDEPYPARAAIGVASLPLGAAVAGHGRLSRIVPRSYSPVRPRREAWSCSLGVCRMELLAVSPELARISEPSQGLADEVRQGGDGGTGQIAPGHPSKG